MKITDLTLIPASKYLFVKIITDTGISGIGEIGAWGFIDAATECLKKFRGYLVGKDPFQIEHHNQYMYRSMIAGHVFQRLFCFLYRIWRI